MFAGNSIRLSAGWAISDDGHGEFLLLNAWAVFWLASD
jgi:hypothetical protein